MSGAEGTASFVPADYEIREPGRLIVTYLKQGDYDPELSATGVISVVRNLSVGLDSELYKPVAALTAGLKVLFSRTDDGVEVSLFEVPS